MVVMGEVAAVALTQRLAHPHWSAVREDPSAVWQAPTGDLVLTVVHLAAWLAAWWLLVGTGHDLVVLAADLRRGQPGRASRLSPSWVQRILQQAIGTVLLMGVIAGPAGATGAAEARSGDTVQVVTPPVPIIGAPTPAAGDPATGVATTQDPPASPQPAPIGDDAAGAGDAGPGDGEGVHTGAGSPQTDADAQPGASAGEVPGATGDVMSGTSDDVHVVAAGENLWVIARQHLSADEGRAPTDREVHARWLQLIQHNRDVLRSGDPDVIFPGERLRLGSGTAAEVPAAASPTLPADGSGTADAAPEDAGAAP